MKNNKLFTRIYLSLLIIFIIILTCLVVLGNKSRIGYLGEFKFDDNHINKTLELNGYNIIDIKKDLAIIDNKLNNDDIINYIFTNKSITNYSYGFRIKYYSKVFRNNDIYGVYVDTNKAVKDNNFIKEIIMDGNGGPFGNLISTKIIDFEKIDNINYKLKLKLIIPLIFIIAILLAYILIDFIPIKYQNKFNILFNKYYNIYFIFSMLIIVVYIFFHNKKFFSWDAINYISRGIDIFYGRNSFTYPGTLFSIINVIPTMLLFGNTQLSHLYYISLIPTVMTVIFSYKILIMYIDKRMAINIIIFIFILFQSYIPIMLSQTYTDGWLLMFIILSVYFILNNKVYASAIMIAIAYFFRSSQALPLGIFIPILLQNNNNFKKNFSKKSIIYYVKYYLTLILVIFIVNFIFNILIKNNSLETKFYSYLFNNLSLKNIFNSFMKVIAGFKFSIISISIFSILSIFFIAIKNLNINLKKLSLLGIIYSLVSIFLVTLLVFSGYEPISDENRYFIYPILILTMSSISLLYEYLNKYLNIHKMINILCILFLLASVYKIKSSVDINSFSSRITEYDYSTDYPKIEENANIYVIGLFSQGVLNYIFKNQSWYDSNIEHFDYFYNNENFNYKYIFTTANYSNIICKYDNRFELVWSSKNGVKYSLYKNKEY